MLDTLNPGKSYLFIDHSAINSRELQAIHLIGYEDVAEDRQRVVNGFITLFKFLGLLMNERLKFI